MLKKSRIVFVLPCLEGGGAERVTLAFLQGLAEGCHDLHLIVFKKTGTLVELIPENVVVHDLDKDRLRSSFYALFITIKQLKPEIIFSSHGYVNLALLLMSKLLSKKPTIILREANTPSRSLPSQRYTFLFNKAYRYLYPHADALICQSRLMQEELMNDFSIPEEKLHLIYNPTNELVIREGLVPKRLAQAELFFVSAGSLSHQKGFDRLIEWFSMIKGDAKLGILGEGAEEYKLKKLVEEKNLQDRVVFLGYEVKPWDWFAGADAFLLSSRWEGMPNVALEALACGTPVIATDEAGGILDVAEMSNKSAVNVVSAGEQFIHAMNNFDKTFQGKKRPSLLPGVFTFKYSLGKFHALLSQCSKQ